tara:strand:+ start:313 stop:474 length:162 start_codon:yes stop_codon:yes gene_type:complete
MKKKDANITNSNEEVNNICEECKESNKGVFENLIMHGYKICDSCKVSKTIFPI